MTSSLTGNVQLPTTFSNPTLTEHSVGADQFIQQFEGEKLGAGQYVSEADYVEQSDQLAGRKRAGQLKAQEADADRAWIEADTANVKKIGAVVENANQRVIVARKVITLQGNVGKAHIEAERNATQIQIGQNRNTVLGGKLKVSQRRSAALTGGGQPAALPTVSTTASSKSGAKPKSNRKTTRKTKATTTTT